MQKILPRAVDADFPSPTEDLLNFWLVPGREPEGQCTTC